MKTSIRGHAIFFSFFRRVRATSKTRRRVENTRVHFWKFSPVSVKEFTKSEFFQKSGLFQAKIVKLFSDEEETDSIRDGKTVTMDNRQLLLDIFCENNVTHVFSGKGIF